LIFTSAAGTMRGAISEFAGCKRIFRPAAIKALERASSLPTSATTISPDWQPGRLDDHVIAIQNMIVDHRVTFHLQRKSFVRAREFTDDSVSCSSTASSGRPRRCAPSAAARCVPVEHLFPHRLGEAASPQSTALVVAAPHESLALQRRDVLVNVAAKVSFSERAISSKLGE